MAPSQPPSYPASGSHAPPSSYPILLRAACFCPATCASLSSRHPPWVPSWLFDQTLNSSGPEGTGLTHFSQVVRSLASDTTAPVIPPRVLALLFPLCELASLPAPPVLSCPSYSRKSHLHAPMQGRISSSTLLSMVGLSTNLVCHTPDISPAPPVASPVRGSVSLSSGSELPQTCVICQPLLLASPERAFPLCTDHVQPVLSVTQGRP